MSNPVLNLADLSLLRALPASTEPPMGLTREQQARAEDLPWGLIRGGRRTDLGDYVLALVEERDAYKRAKEENDERFQLEAGEQRARADALQKRLDALLAPAEGIDLKEVLALHAEAIATPPNPSRKQENRFQFLLLSLAEKAPALAREVAHLREALEEARPTIAEQRKACAFCEDDDVRTDIYATNSGPQWLCDDCAANGEDDSSATQGADKAECGP